MRVSLTESTGYTTKVGAVTAAIVALLHIWDVQLPVLPEQIQATLGVLGGLLTAIGLRNAVRP